MESVLSKELYELSAAFTKTYDRLLNINAFVSQLDDDEQEAGVDDTFLESKDLVTEAAPLSYYTLQLEILYDRFIMLAEHQHRRTSLMQRICDRHTCPELYQMQEKLDILYAGFQIPTQDPYPEWKATWDALLQSIRELFQQEIFGECLIEACSEPDSQVEALAAVKHCLSHSSILSDDKSHCQAVDVDVLKAVFRRLVSISQGGVPALPQWYIPLHDLRIDDHVVFATPQYKVFHAVWMQSEETHVLVNRLASVDSKSVFDDHMDKWTVLKHDHLLSVLGGNSFANPYVIMECSSVPCTLEAYLNTSADHRRRLFRLLAQAAEGLGYLHDQDVIHTDLRGSHIFVSDDGKAKVACLVAQGSTSKPLSGSIRWSAPELIQGEGHTTASDVYAFGMCIIEAMTNDLPWGLLDDTTIQEKISQGMLPEDATSKDEAWNLICKMCALTPSDRPTMLDVHTDLSSLADAEQKEGDDATNILERQVSQASMSSMHSRARRSRDQSMDRYTESRSSFSRSVSESSFDLDTSHSSTRLPPGPLTTVTLNQRWLGIKIGLVGNKITVSKFLQAGSGAIGEIQASGKVELGDVLVSVNNKHVSGMTRQQVGSLVQSLPRPIDLAFRKEPSLLSKAYRFLGLRVDTRFRDRGSNITLPQTSERMFSTSGGSFSVGIWFSLAEASDTFLGGVLLGCQDSSFEDPSWAYTHRPLVVVDPKGDLCCSFVNDQEPTVVSPDLPTYTWHYCVVTYGEQTQTVYLNGDLVSTTSGKLHRDWRRLNYVTVGTGCMSGLLRCKPSSDFAGWYGFHGLVYDVQIWPRVLSDIQVQMIMRGAKNGVDKPKFSLLNSTKYFKSEKPYDAKRVKSTRPDHVVAQVYE